MTEDQEIKERLSRMSREELENEVVQFKKLLDYRRDQAGEARVDNAASFKSTITQVNELHDSIIEVAERIPGILQALNSALKTADRITAQAIQVAKGDVEYIDEVLNGNADEPE